MVYLVCTADALRARGAFALLAVPVLAVVLMMSACAAGRSDGGATPSSSPSASGSAAVAARLDGEAIPRGEVARAIGLSRLSAKELSYKRALAAVIRRHLLAREAARLGVSVPDAAVEARLSQVEDQTGGAGALQQSLATVGLSVADYREELRAGLLAERVAARKFAGTVATRAQALRFYRSHRDLFTEAAAVRLAEIVVKTKSLGQAVLERLHKGYSFAQVARAYTMDDQAKATGGVLGWIQRASLPAPIDRAVATLGTGHTAGPIQYLATWHVVKVLGRRPAHVAAFAQVRADIGRQLTLERRTALLSAWLERARRAAQVSVEP
jgi:foldase protein PrsA